MKTHGFRVLHSGLLITLATFFLAAPLCAQLTNFQQLHSFGNTNLAGLFPRRLIECSDGRLYGVAHLGTIVLDGMIYSINRDGTGYRILHRFKKGEPPGENLASLLEGTDGALYGATSEGAANNQGAVFRINKNGTAITVLHAFPTSVPNEGHNPPAPLIEGTDGALYGVTRQGGVTARGAVFKLQKDGTGFQVLKSFGGTNDGTYPLGGLTEATDGWLYGTTSRGGTGGAGTIFRIRKDGSDYQILVHLLGGTNEPAAPFAEMIEGSDGALYGTSREGGPTNAGTIFKLQKDGTGFVVLRTSGTTTPLVEGRDDALYGTAGGTLFKMNKDGSDFRVLHQFPSSIADGNYSLAPLVLSRDGSFYGSAPSGGTYSYGILFRLNPTNESYSIIWQFSREGGPGRPFGPLAPDRFGNLYGATAWGGDANSGVIYRIHQNGTGFEILHSIPRITTARSIVQSLIVASDGNVYGTTSPDGVQGPGTLFKLAPDGSGFSVFQTFDLAPSDGLTPQCRITEGSDGKLYGATRWGGSGGSNIVFRVNKDGTGYEILRVFGQVAGDGYSLGSPVIEASDGTLYGVTSYGGTNGGGTVFRMNRDGTGYAQLHHFKANNSEGYYPSGPLLENADGFLYGVTAYGGYRNGGTVFKVKKDGSAFAVVWRQTTWDRGLGSYIHGPLLEGNDGALYGTTRFGGNYDSGAIFKVNKDGTGFTHLHHFDATSSGYYSAGMVRGNDGAFYGTGGLDAGMLYRFGPMIALALQPSTVQLTCTGVPGIIYEVQRSSDLQNWSTILQRPMPASPAITHDDSTPPPNAAFYRVVPMSN